MPCLITCMACQAKPNAWVPVVPQVYICAPEVLMLFQDNFDYQVTFTLTTSHSHRPVPCPLPHRLTLIRCCCSVIRLANLPVSASFLCQWTLSR